MLNSQSAFTLPTSLSPSILTLLSSSHSPSPPLCDISASDPRVLLLRSLSTVTCSLLNPCVPHVPFLSHFFFSQDTLNTSTHIKRDAYAARGSDFSRLLSRNCHFYRYVGKKLKGASMQEICTIKQL